MLKLALRNIFRQKTRTSTTLGAIVFGVLGLILSGGFVEDIYVQLREATIHSQLGHVQIQKAGHTELGRTNPYAYMIDNPNKLAARVKAIPRVSDILQRVEFSGLITSGRADLPIVGEGVEPDKESALGTFITVISGRQLSDSDDFGILVGQGVAGALKLEPGQFATIMVSTPDGALNSLEFEVIGVFRTFSKNYDDRAVRIPLRAAQDLLVSNNIHSVILSLDGTEATDAVTARLRDELSPSEFEVHAWHELAHFYQQTVALYQRQFGMFQLIILVMVLLSVANSVNLAIFERTGEFGTLMALGNSRKDVFMLILAEYAVLGVVGGSIGAVLGIALAWGITEIGIPMPPPPNSNSGYSAHVRIVPWVIGMAWGVGTVATWLAAILPARRASRLPVVDALRQNI